MNIVEQRTGYYVAGTEHGPRFVFQLAVEVWPAEEPSHDYPGCRESRDVIEVLGVERCSTGATVTGRHSERLVKWFWDYYDQAGREFWEEVTLS